MGENFNMKLLEELWAFDVQTLSTEEKLQLTKKAEETKQYLIAECIFKKLGNPKGLFEIYLKQKKWNNALDCIAKMNLNETETIQYKLRISEVLLNENKVSLACLIMKKDEKYPLELLDLLLEKKEYYYAFFLAQITENDKYLQKIVNTAYKRSIDFVETFKTMKIKYGDIVENIKTNRQERYEAFIAAQELENSTNNEPVEPEANFTFKSANIVNENDYEEEVIDNPQGKVIKRIYKFHPPQEIPELLKNDTEDLGKDMEDLNINDKKLADTKSLNEEYKYCFEVIEMVYGLEETIKKLSMVLAGSGEHVKFMRSMNKIYLDLAKFVRSEHHQVWLKSEIDDEVLETIYLEGLEDVSPVYWSAPKCVEGYISVFTDEYKK